MGKGGGSAPEPDPQIGEAALKQAATGEKYLEFMKGQAATGNAWAKEDRGRYKSLFQPLEDRYVREAQSWDTPERRAAASAEAAGDVQLAGRQAQGQAIRNAMRLGVSPTSGAFQAMSRGAATQTQLASVGARNMADRRIEAEGDAKEANAINLGKGMAVNPGTSLGLANGAASQGFQGAQQGYAGMASTLNQDYQNRMQSWNANQESSGALFGALGNLAGMFLMSDENAKTDKAPVKRSLLKAVEGMPIEEWTYKPGAGDGGRHVGTYAQDFQRETGKGDGRSINVIDALGTTMGAVQELSAKVDKMAGAAPRSRSLPKGRAA